MDVKVIVKNVSGIFSCILVVFFSILSLLQFIINNFGAETLHFNVSDTVYYGILTVSSERMTLGLSQGYESLQIVANSLSLCGFFIFGIGLISSYLMLGDSKVAKVTGSVVILLSILSIL